MTAQAMPAPLSYRIWARTPDGAAAFALREMPSRYTRPAVLAAVPVAHDASVSDFPTLYRVDIAACETPSDRWTLYGLPGGYTTCWRASDDAARRHRYDGQTMTPLVTFRARPDQMPARLNAARGWALECCELVA